MAKWIWTGGAPSENEYVIARSSFTADAPSAPELLVSADSDFAAFLNGEFLGRGQFSDYPQAKTFTRIPLVNCRAGRNELEIRAYFCGGSFLTHIAGTPRLWAEAQGKKRRTVLWLDLEEGLLNGFRTVDFYHLLGGIPFTFTCALVFKGKIISNRLRRFNSIPNLEFTHFSLIVLQMHYMHICLHPLFMHIKCILLFLCPPKLSVQIMTSTKRRHTAVNIG